MFGRWRSRRPFAMASATLLSVTLVGADDVHPSRAEAASDSERVSPVSVAIYRRCLSAALRFRWTTLVVNFAVIRR